MDFLKKNTQYVIAVIASILYYLFAYETHRTEFPKMLVLWAMLFVGFFFFVKNNGYSFKSLVVISFLFRIVLLFAEPNLSQDYYRFIWDGRMLFQGYNPYLSLPITFIEQNTYPVDQAETLFYSMGNMHASNYTNYPPVNQLCFFIAALFSEKSIFGALVVLRIFTIVADLGILYFGSLLLKNLGKNPKLIFLYLLNPFVIIELTGNLHFESVMLFFLVWSLHLLQQKNCFLAAIALGLSVNVKLIPLLFLPIFIKWFVMDDQGKFVKKKIFHALLFYLLVIITNVILFLPFIASNFINNYLHSVGLWFRNFEFNASFYYIFRAIGYQFRGYNEIAIIGKITPVLSVIFLLVMALYRKNKSMKDLIVSMLFALSFYYFLTTTMHPWYLATLLMLSVFTKYRFTVVWSAVMILSYHAYANIPWRENLWIVALEYIIVYGFLCNELLVKKKATFNL